MKRRLALAWCSRMTHGLTAWLAPAALCATRARRSSDCVSQSEGGRLSKHAVTSWWPCRRQNDVVQSAD